MIAALVHTQGFVLDRVFYPLEMAYRDVVGCRRTFHIASPLTYGRLMRVAPKTPVQVILRTRGACPRSEVVRFLRERHAILTRAYRRAGPVPGSVPGPVLFGHKGESYQRDLLDEAGVPRVNVEGSGIVPPLARLERELPHVARLACPFHVRPETRCSEHVVRLLEAVSNSRNSTPA